MSVWSLSLCFSQVYKCSPSSRTPSQKAVPAATGRSRTATCWRPSISTGTRTAWSVPAVTAGWARWAPHSTPKPTSSCAGETTYGKKGSWHFHSICVTFNKHCIHITLKVDNNLSFILWNGAQPQFINIKAFFVLWPVSFATIQHGGKFNIWHWFTMYYTFFLFS